MMMMMMMMMMIPVTEVEKAFAGEQQNGKKS
jgi:hypothetical protein